MSVHDNVLRATAFHALAACYPDLHRPTGGMDENAILLKASEELVLLRGELSKAQLALEELDPGPVLAYAMMFDNEPTAPPDPESTREEREALRARILRSNVHCTPGTLNNLILRILNDLERAEKSP